MFGLNRIIIHWTGGTYTPNAIDRKHYHYLITGSGSVIEGQFKPEDNINCYDGKYAEHCGGGNTGSIGVSLCGKLGFKNRDSVGSYPLTKIQIEAGCKFIAKLCHDYNIPVMGQVIMTHRTFGIAHPKTSSAGKIDICYLPPFPEVKEDDIDSFLLKKIKWYYEKGGN